MKSRLVRPAGDDLARHRVRQRDVGADVEARPHVGPLGGCGPPRIDRVELRPTLHALEQVVKEDRMRFPGVRSPEQDAVRFFNLAIRARPTTHAECRRQTGDARGVSRTVAAIEVVRAHHHARELLRGVVHLVRAFRTAEQAERLPAMRVADRGKPVRRPVQRFVPRRLPKRSRRERHEREDGRFASSLS